VVGKSGRSFGVCMRSRRREETVLPHSLGTDVRRTATVAIGRRSRGRVIRTIRLSLFVFRCGVPLGGIGVSQVEHTRGPSEY